MLEIGNQSREGFSNRLMAGSTLLGRNRYPAEVFSIDLTTCGGMRWCAAGRSSPLASEGRFLVVVRTLATRYAGFLDI
jgi:hypothetical protein